MLKDKKAFRAALTGIFVLLFIVGYSVNAAYKRAQQSKTAENNVVQNQESPQEEVLQESSVNAQEGINVSEDVEEEGTNDENQPEAPRTKNADGTYTVVEGDTLWDIAYEFGISPDELKQINGLKTDVLQIGKVLSLKGTASQAAAVEKPSSKLASRGGTPLRKPSTDSKVSSSSTKSEEPSKNISAPSVSGKSAALDWWKEVQYIFPRGAVAKVTDVNTGKSFSVKRTFGTNHADCEALTAKDSDIIKSIWGGWSWERRPVVVQVGGKRIAASMTAMPHAGLDKYPALKTVSGRSGGYGTGTNLDAVKGNDMDGHFDIHFLNSRTHGTNKVDSKHQATIKQAIGK